MQPVDAEQSCAKGFVPGDVVEIQTDKGLAYVQVTHLHRSYPEIIRVLPGLHDAPCDGADLLINLPTRFRVITPLSAAVADGQLTGRHVGHYPVPKPEQAFPHFRMPVRDRSGQVIYWWLWDGDGLSVVETGTVTADLPLREVVPPEVLRMRLVERLSPSDA